MTTQEIFIYDYVLPYSQSVPPPLWLVPVRCLPRPRPPSPPSRSTRTGPGPKSKAEAEAVKAVMQSQAQPPDDQIAAVEALSGWYADTVYKSFALEIEAEAYLAKKNDNPKAIVVYGEQALAADPKNYDADNLLANIYA